MKRLLFASSIALTLLSTAAFAAPRNGAHDQAQSWNRDLLARSTMEQATNRLRPSGGSSSCSEARPARMNENSPICAMPVAMVKVV